MTAAAHDVRHVGCPACGATLPRREDARTLRCRACGTRSVLADADGATRFQVMPTVSRERAVSTVRTALSTWPVRNGAADRAAIVACDLAWAPFYEFEATQAGLVVRSRGTKVGRTGRVDWSQGRRRFLDEAGNEIEEHEHYRRRTIDVKDTVVLLRTHRASGPAGGPRDWRLGGIDIALLREDPDVRIVPHGSAGVPAGRFVAVTKGRPEAEADLRRMIEVAGRAEMDLLAPDLRYVFVPLWVVRLRIDGHPYSFVLDAVRGTVLSGRAPESPRRGVMFVLLVGMYLGIPIGKVVAGAAVGGGQAALTALALFAEFGLLGLGVIAVLLVPLAYAWGEFRFRGEVEFGPDGARVVKSSRPARTFLEKAIDALVEAADKALEHRGQQVSWWDRPW